MLIKLLAGYWRVRGVVKCDCHDSWKQIMPLFSQVASRQLSPYSRFTGCLWPVFEQLKCHYSDEVVIYGGMTSAPVPVFACKFTSDGLHGNLLATGDEEGSVRLMDTRRHASLALVKEIEAHRNAVFDVAWFPRGTKLLTGSGDATVRLWDVVGGVMLDEFKAHSASVKTVDIKMNEPSMFVSGGRDGSIHVWDTRCSKRGNGHKPVNSISAAHKKAEAAMATNGRQRGRRSESLVGKSGDTKHSVTAVLFHGNHCIASCGTADGLIKLWDLRRTYTNSRLEPPPCWHTFEPLSEAGRQCSFTSLVSGPYQSNLFASCSDDMCYMYNSSGLNKLPVRVFSGHQNSSFYVKSCVSPDGQYLLSGSSCGNAFLWQIDHPEVPPLMLTGHTKEVTAVGWCPTDPSRIVTCSDDNDLRLWRVVHGKRSPGEVTGTCESYSGRDHLRGMDTLKRHMEGLSSKPSHSRTALKPLQFQSTIKHVPTSSTARPAVISDLRESVLLKQNSASPLDCKVDGAGVTSAAGTSKKAQPSNIVLGTVNSSMGNAHNIVSTSIETPERGKVAESSISATSDYTPAVEICQTSCTPRSSRTIHKSSSKINHSSKAGIELETSESVVSHTSCTKGPPLSISRHTEEMTRPMNVLEETSDQFESKDSQKCTSATPEISSKSFCVSSGSAKRKLELMEKSTPKAKRRRTMDKDSRSSTTGRKRPKQKVELASTPSEKTPGQRTMQSFFRPI